MPQKPFSIYAVKRLLKTQGQQFEFKRAKKNAYGEPIPDSPKETVATVLGVYHETFVRPVISTQDGSAVRSLPQPNILCLWESVQGLDLTEGDELTIGKNSYKLHGMVDIQKLGIAVDLVLEMVEDGGIQV